MLSSVKNKPHSKYPGFKSSLFSSLLYNPSGYKYAPDIDVLNYKKYDSPQTSKVIKYVLYQFIIALGVGSALLFLNNKLEAIQIFFIILFTISTLITCGALLENKSWLKYFEYGRILLSIMGLYLFKELVIFNTFATVVLIIQSTSIIWFYYLQNIFTFFYFFL